MQTGELATYSFLFCNGASVVLFFFELIREQKQHVFRFRKGCRGHLFRAVAKKREVTVRRSKSKKKNACEFRVAKKLMVNNAGLVGGWMRGKLETYKLQKRNLYIISNGL